MMEADSTSKTSVNCYQITRQNIQENSHFNSNSIFLYAPQFQYARSLANYEEMTGLYDHRRR
jgi:hypothetical protein